jgi:hypothetical protein
MILRSSHFNETGFVKKSLHPAANATTRSDCNDEAVRATMMTEERKGDGGAASLTSRIRGIGCSAIGVEGNTPMLFIFSSFRISLVASIPSMTGSWISIYLVNTAQTDLSSRLTRIRWNAPVRHFSTASRPSLAVW